MRLTAIALGLMLGGTFPALAQEAAAPGGPKPPGSEGIKVHGHWTIEVREPDGRLVSHREFENALYRGGRALASMMGRGVTALAWAVFLGPYPGPCTHDDGTPAPCEINEPSHPRTGHEVSKNLQVVVGTFPFDDTIKLTGSTTAAKSTSISTVYSQMLGAAAFGNVVYEFSSRDLATPVPVAAGQIIQVSVVFSFS
jgi:hypothetical protein